MVAAALLLFSCGEQGEGVDNDSKGIHLRTSPRVEYYLNKEANDQTEVAVRETFEGWGEATHFDFVYRGRHRAGLRRDGKNTVKGFYFMGRIDEKTLRRYRELYRKLIDFCDS